MYDKDYFWSVWGDCTAKPLVSLKHVNGLCPNRPSFEGTYSAAAVAWFAHTHDFAPPDSEAQALDIYVVTLTPAFPPLDFPLYGPDGKVAKKISIIPTAMSERDRFTTHNRLMEPLNYYIIDWKTDSRGTPYSVLVRVNFEAASMGYDKGHLGSNWDGDIMIEYTIDLLSATQTAKTGTLYYDMVPINSSNKTVIANDAARRTSGALKVKGGKYWAFKAASADTTDITIEPNEVAGIIIGQWKFMVHINIDMMAGYTISGSTHDGVYMDIGHTYGTKHGSPAFGTPPTCEWPSGYGDDSAVDKGTGCRTLNHAYNPPGLGTPDPITEKKWRTFEFSPDPTLAGNYLPTPMYLAAKYGGYTDYNKNSKPDPGEWEGEDGKPKTYFETVNVAELPMKLDNVFREISRSISTSTAASASIDTLAHGGVSVQTLYYPVYANPEKPSEQVRWVGSIYGLFLDKWGNLREDNDGNGELDMANGPDGSGGDYVVTFNSLSHRPDVTPQCYEFGSYITRCYDPVGNNHLTPLPDGNRHPVSVHRIVPLFDTGKWLAHLDSAKLASGPRPVNAPATLDNSQRRILYGVPATSSNPAGTALFSTANVGALEKLMLHDNYLESLPGNMNRTTAAQNLINWITGVEVTGWRSRSVGDPWTDNATKVVWRMGDVINSKPILVGAPSSNYDLLYGDTDYAQFKTANASRRQMAYFGANDGMLHAVNIGFPSSLEDGKVKFKKTDGDGAVSHDLGAETWAFIPAAVLPQLRWLPDPLYSHAYYVDLKPLINDVKIDGEWRSVLLGGLRLGGRSIQAPD
jgi:hypothetical protein